MAVDWLVAAVNRAPIFLERHKFDALFPRGARNDDFAETFAYPNSMLIYRNKVAIFTSLQEFITVLIESEEIADAERQKFEMLWTTTEP